MQRVTRVTIPRRVAMPHGAELKPSVLFFALPWMQNHAILRQLSLLQYAEQANLVAATRLEVASSSRGAFTGSSQKLLPHFVTTRRSLAGSAMLKLSENTLDRSLAQ